MAQETDINRVHNNLSKIERMVIFAGTGVSLGTGVPEWEKLMKALDKEQKVGGVDIEIFDEYNYPEYAQMSFNEFHRQDKGEDFYKVIERELLANIAPYSTVQLESVCTTGRIVTTNFESSFEKAFQRRFEMERKGEKCLTQVLPSIDKNLLKEEHSVTYLHGRIENRNIVIRTCDYEKHYGQGNSVVKEFLKGILGEYGIVFIGFSFNDRYMKRTLKEIHQELVLEGKEDDRNVEGIDLCAGKEESKHYAFLRSAAKTDEEKKLEWALDNDLRAMGIKAIRYGDHRDVIDCLERIRKLKSA